MIAKLNGIVDSLGKDFAVIDVNGVGYLVFASSRTLGLLGGAGNRAQLHIETIIREDQFSLYGFTDAQEREWFKLLTSVQGVGAKSALAMLGVLPPDKLSLAIAAQDKSELTRADGVGPKLAARILTELKDKAGAMNFGNVIVNLKNAPAGPMPVNSNTNDAASALVNLGYGRSDAYAAVASASKKLGEDAAVGELIRVSLKELSA